MGDEIKIAITQPKLFTKKAIVVLNAYSILGLIPMLLTVFLTPLFFKLFNPMIALVLGLMTLALACFLPVYFLSIWMGNPYLRKLVRRSNLSAGCIIQLAIIPRVKSGFWAFMEDADDIGLLSFTDDRLVFKGDVVEFSLPYSQIKNVRKRNIGRRGWWIYGDRILLIFWIQPAKNLLNCANVLH